MPVRYSALSAGPSTRRNAPQAAAPSVDYAKLSKAELQQEASARGLATSGTKADLVARLKGT